MTAVPWNSSDEKRANLSSREVLPAIDGMAVITDIEDVEWSGGAYVFRRGQLLKSSNWLAIEAGHLEIEVGPRRGGCFGGAGPVCRAIHVGWRIAIWQAGRRCAALG